MEIYGYGVVVGLLFTVAYLIYVVLYCVCKWFMEFVDEIPNAPDPVPWSLGGSDIGVGDTVSILFFGAVAWPIASMVGVVRGIAILVRGLRRVQKKVDKLSDEKPS